MSCNSNHKKGKNGHTRTRPNILKQMLLKIKGGILIDKRVSGSKRWNISKYIQCAARVGLQL